MSSEPLFEVPNLDAVIDPDDMQQLGVLFARLSQYCAYKATAMQYRLAGKITAALAEESRADLVYKQLPAKYRW